MLLLFAKHVFSNGGVPQLHFAPFMPCIWEQWCRRLLLNSGTICGRYHSDSDSSNDAHSSKSFPTAYKQNNEITSFYVILSMGTCGIVLRHNYT